jgi:hypothetical protein
MFVEKIHYISETHSSLFVESTLYDIVFHSELDMKVDILLLADLIFFYLWFNCEYSSEQQTFVIIFCILDDTPGKVNTIYASVSIFESTKFKGKYFFENIDSKLDELLE